MNRTLILCIISLSTLATTSASAGPFDKMREDLKESGWNPNKKQADDGLAETQGVTSALHEEHVGEILFTTTPIPEGGPAASQFVDSAELGPDLYVQAYMPDSLYNATVKDAELEPSVTMAAHLTVRIDGSECEALFGRGNEFMDWRLHSTTLSSALVARDGGDLPEAFGRCVAKLQSSLTPGAHELELEIRARSTKPRPGETEPLATGHLTLTVKGTTLDPTHRSLCQMPQATHSDASVEQAFEKRLGAGVREVRLLSRDWIVNHHDLTGAILSRYYLAAVAVTDDDGTCSYVTDTFMQQYTGSGYSDSMTVSTETQGRGEIPCACLH